MDGVELRLLGDVAVLWGGEPVALPASRKTRALLAFLAATGRPQRRERLCTLLWNVPDDPKGALRWSLSKLRQILNRGEETRLQTDRELISLAVELLRSDLGDLRAAAALGWAHVPTQRLKALAGYCLGRFCDGLDLQRCDEFELWCIAEREDVRRMQIALLHALLSRLKDRPEEALPFARHMVDLDPLDGDARAELVLWLARADRRGEAEQQRDLAIRFLEAEDMPVPACLRAPLEIPLTVPEARSAPSASASPLQQTQRIYFCEAKDGTTIAYSCVGNGPPLVKTANWLNHLEYDWESPISSHWIRALAQHNTLVRYDERGNGLSDWNCDEISFAAFVDDLETVVDHLALDQFDLLGISQGCAVAIAYAVRYPERVKRLILYGGYAAGWAMRADPQEMARREAMLTLTRQGWGQTNPAFRQLFSTLFFPDADAEQTGWFNELQRISTSPEGAERLSIAFSKIQVSHLLAKVVTPTLVLHVRDDAVVPFSAGRDLASQIPGARLVALEGRNHLLLEQDASWPRLEQEILAFLAEPVM